MSSNKPQKNHKPLLCGIDPGGTGSIAFYNYQTKTLAHLFDMPSTKTKGKTNIEVEHFANIIRTHAPDTLIAIIEENQARPKQGLSSTFKFGYSSGLGVGICAALSIRIHLTKPQIWKTLMGLNTNKTLSREKAIALFPDKKDLFKRAKDDGRAEAALLAVFGERLLK